MAYNDFTLEKLKQQFGLLVQEERTPVVSAPPVTLSALLRDTLAENIPVALDISTEKARSEFIIAPVLMEVRRQLDYRITAIPGAPSHIQNKRF